MFDRTILEELKKWAEKKDRKALVLRGARQVGKTSAVKIFAKQFEIFIDLNLEKSAHRNIFETEYPFDDLLNRIFFHAGKMRNSGKTLIFIDEIQNSPKAVALLRYFYEEAPELFVIAAGSLLENILDKNISFPVGRVEFMVMHPCTFREYLGAIGEKVSLSVYDENEIPEYAHDKMLTLFKRYSSIGGMPEIIENYAKHRDLTRLGIVYSSLLTSYKEDVEKYALTDVAAKYIRHIISTAFSEAGCRVTFERFGYSSYRSREIKEAFDVLQKTMLLRLVYPVTSVKLPVIPNLRKKPRLHVLDTGLVNHSLGIEEELIAVKYLDDVYRGIIAEHIVGQEFTGTSHLPDSTPGFWVRDKKQSSAEVDYIAPYKGMIIPVEVKSGPSGKLRSLHQFVDTAPHNWAVRFYSGKFVVEDAKTLAGKNFKLISLPIYTAGKLHTILKHIIGG
ncbi:MAG: AAA family ATPase [Bacteroidales bacterium]|nr:AAA family ATPase [Bacteroidales bacterium]